MNKKDKVVNENSVLNMFDEVNAMVCDSNLHEKLTKGLVILDKLLERLNGLLINSMDDGFYNEKTIAEHIGRLVRVLREVIALRNEFEASKGVRTDPKLLSDLRDFLNVFLRSLKDDLIKKFGVSSNEAVSYVEIRKREIEDFINRILNR
jgi:hypothetical protein